ncbi:UvrD-helicase domain-containing protein [Baekduia sp. Peel2402]|uniref:UvrD-helicase domain-containing protein n=1 Tax=Baekduia sp. Peel2402 TaxID=3458296 RepID=UPI00403E50E4
MSFDVCGPLPSGVTVLEASAGTGKTYTIAALATRYVADGVPLEQLLLVTFTRLATGELRDRVRQRLTAARAALDAVLEGGPDPVDWIEALLADGTRAEVIQRRGHLAVALADFDAATITTTHGFCQEVLGGLGVAGDVDRGHHFSDDARDLVDDVVDDLYVRAFRDRAPVFGRDEARQVAAAAIANPTAPLAPPPHDEAPRRRHELATDARDELDRRKRALALMTYDDLVTRLRETLEGPGGDAVAARLRARYRVALVDEFQDTDPDQWAIMHVAFGEGSGTTLVLIGDPKQAVYAFRGADVYAYLEARREAGRSETLGVNWRSDGGLVRALDTLFSGKTLGHPEIAYSTVVAAPEHEAARLDGAPVATPLRIRVVARHDPDVRKTPTGWSSAVSAREHVARDVAGDVARLLASGARVDGERALGPGDVAVLVRKNAEARKVKEALEAAGVPAVVNGAGSVFATESARDWLRLLEALERPESLPRARAAALTAFVGWSTEAIAGASEDRWEALQATLHGWAAVLRRAGVATLVETITEDEGLPERLLSVVGGERSLTDVRHVGELLHAAAVDGRLGITALAGWLRRRMAADERDAGAEDRARRLESDAEAVQVLTIHRSKGLEFGVVYCPFLWDPFWIPDEPEPAVYHDAARGDARTIDVSLDPRDAAFAAHLAQDREEQRGEELRLAYVALTRAKHQAVVWWASSFNARSSAFGRLVLDPIDPSSSRGRGPGAEETAAEARERLAALVAASGGAIGLERSLVDKGARWSRPGTEAVDLVAASFTRGFDERWRRLSYSSITAGAYEARVASETEEAAGSDDPDVVAPIEASAPSGPPVPLADAPAGTRFGTFVHAILEAVDFSAADLPGELSLAIAEQLRRRPLDVGDPIILAGGLDAALSTPLGPLLDDRRLRDLAPADRLDELTFELPLAGGDEPTATLTLAAIASTLRAHLAADDPLFAYADRLDDPMLKADLRGYLTGTIDLVARWPDDTYTIVDYKTNKLAAPGEPLTAFHHRPSLLAEEMHRSHYALQALLYGVALHRYLRWRAPSTTPTITIAYTFLRGMVGAQTPREDGAPCGVFAWRPPSGLLAALSDVLDGAPSAPEAATPR